MTHSAIYEGTIRHRRFAVRRHEFRYRIAMAYVDLDELPGLLGGRLVRSRPGLVRFRRSDYLGDPAVPLAEAVRTLVAERLGDAPQGPIRLLTHLRTFGHCFNPVSFYYCFAPGRRAPRGDRRRGHQHAVGRAPRLRARRRASRSRRAASTRPCTSRRSCRWTSATPGARRRPGRRCRCRSRAAANGRRAFDATLGLRRRPLTRRSLARVTARHPAATLRMLALIYGHAVALKLKGVPVQPHPRAPMTARVARRLVMALFRSGSASGS